MKNPIDPEAPRRRFLTEIVIPACVLVGIILFNHFVLRGATVASVFNFLAMGLFALYLPTRWMVFWAVCFACSSVFMLCNPAFSRPGPFNLLLSKETRSFGVLVGAVMTVVLCASRREAIKGHAQLTTLVTKLPVPFVLSDQNGTLLHVSEEAGQFMKISPKEAVGQSYFALLFNAPQKGAFIQKYLNLLDSNENGESHIELRLLNCPEKSWRGTWIPVELDSGKCLITVIAPLPAGTTA